MHPALITSAQMENKLESKKENIKKKEIVNPKARKGGWGEDTSDQEERVWKNVFSASPLTLIKKT